MKKPKAIQIYLDTANQFEALTDAQAGKVIKALLCFADTEKEEDISCDPAAQVMFLGLRNSVKRDFERYRRRCEINKQNAHMGAGAPIGNQNARKYDADPRAGQRKTPGMSFSEKTIETIQEKEKEEEKKKEEEKYPYKEREKNKEENKDKYEERDKKEEKAEEKKEKEQPQNGCPEILSLFRRCCPSVAVDLSDGTVSKEDVDRAQSALCGQSFEELFKKVQRSDFLTGRSGKWKGCTFRWVLLPGNIARILRGMYDNPRAPTSSFSRGVTSSIDFSKHKSLFDE